MVRVSRVREIRVHSAFSNMKKKKVLFPTLLVIFGVIISAHVVSSSDPTQLSWRASGLWGWP